MPRRKRTPTIPVGITTERELQDALSNLKTGLLSLYGYLHTHFRPAREHGSWATPLQGHKGFPDIEALRPPRRIVAELKAATEIDTDQAMWLDGFEAVGFEVYIWRPEHLELIPGILAGDAPRVTHWREDSGYVDRATNITW